MLRIFISYPRVIQRFCAMLTELLEAYEIWVDQRMFAGQQWWQEILDGIEKSQVVLFLLAPDTLNSRYCMEEFRIARERNKIIIPILVDVCDNIPDDISRHQMVDMRYGVTVTAVRELLNALVVAERSMRSPFVSSMGKTSKLLVGAMETGVTDTVNKSDVITAPKQYPGFHTETFISDVVRAYESHDYDTAIVLIDEAKNRRLSFAGIDVLKMLADAKARMEEKEYRVAMDIEYRGIGTMITSKDAKMREAAVKMFEKFRQSYPEYDPLNLSALCLPLLLPEIRWCAVKAGEVTLEYADTKRRITHHVEAFNISKYPISNAQFQIFIDAPDGYCNKQWWTFSRSAKAWREKHAQPLPQRSPYGDHPRVNLTWYEAMAFCYWLRAKTNWRVSLPKEQQWQRAAQGDDNRPYPWGTRYYRQLCNGQDGRVGTSSAVGRYTKGGSPFDVMDMAGNVWEYCYTLAPNKNGQPTGEIVAKGGSYLSPHKELRSTSRKMIKPGAAFGTVGFRIVVNFGL